MCAMMPMLRIRLSGERSDIKTSDTVLGIENSGDNAYYPPLLVLAVIEPALSGIFRTVAKPEASTFPAAQ